MADPLLTQAAETEACIALEPPPAQPPFPDPPQKPFGKLYAIADIHLSYKPNREALERLEPRPDDGLILLGDVGETAEHLRLGFSKATECFKKVYWCPGNHELYTIPTHKDVEGANLRGEEKYMFCVEVAREYGIITPEDPYDFWWVEGEDGSAIPHVICPIFTLYDYTFRPPEIKPEDAVAWAREKDIEATDEFMLHPDPYESRQAWCDVLVSKTTSKLTLALAKYGRDVKFIIAGHWPLRQDLVDLRAIPRFSPWCGTVRTEDWHLRFNCEVVVSGHIHVRRTDWRDNIRFEECSLGYPKQWNHCRDEGLDINDMMREILPGQDHGNIDRSQTVWRRYGYPDSQRH
ncbi:MAG: hypothetical protein M1820_001199 [Bogoriella megaspora]|nr:MAG: hypothetical protein M1820_001199 [Bogoriella megaspora]